MNDWHERMTEDLQLRGLSERTQEAYLRAVRKLAEHADTIPERIAERQVREYQAATSDCTFENAQLRGSGALHCYPAFDAAD